MVLGLRKETVDDVITVLAAVVIFNSLPKLQAIGKYFSQYPIIFLILGIALIAFRKRIADTIGE